MNLLRVWGLMYYKQVNPALNAMQDSGRPQVAPTSNVIVLRKFIRRRNFVGATCGRLILHIRRTRIAATFTEISKLKHTNISDTTERRNTT